MMNDKREKRTQLFKRCILTGVVLFGLIAVSSSLSCSQKPETVTFGNVPLEATALFYIAEDQNFFAANDINLSIKTYDTGLNSVNGMLNGDVDIGAGAEYAIVGKVLSNANITVLGTFDKAQTIYVIARKDSGITNISDLKGKRIGVVRQTTLEFYLGRFLSLNGINIGDVTLVNVTPPQYEAAIMSGNMDAIICNQPYVDAIKSQLGDNAVVWPAQNGQPTYSLLVCKQDWAANHPKTIIKFLNSLEQAENTWLIIQRQRRPSCKKAKLYGCIYDKHLA